MDDSLLVRGSSLASSFPPSLKSESELRELTHSRNIIMRRQAVVPAPQPSTSTEGHALNIRAPGRFPCVPTRQPSALFFKGFSQLDLSAQLQMDQVASNPRSALSIRAMWGKRYFVLILLAAMLSFVLDDFRVLLMPLSADSFVDTAVVVLVALFAADIALRTKNKPAYAGSLFFWFDIFGTVGLLADVETIYGLRALECESWYLYRAKIMIRTARLCSIALRIIQQLNLTMITSNNRNEEMQREATSSQSVVDLPGISAPMLRRASLQTVLEDHDSSRHSDKVSMQYSAHADPKALGKKYGTFRKLWKEEAVAERLTHTDKRKRLMFESRISKTVTARLVGLVTLIGIQIGVFAWVSVAFFHADDLAPCSEYGLQLINSAAGLPRAQEIIEAFIEMHSDAGRLSVLRKLTLDRLVWWVGDSSDIRDSEVCVVTVSRAQAEFSIRHRNQVFAVFDLGLVTLICALFLYVSLKTSADMRDMVLFPLERMIATVQMLWRNPWLFSRNAPVVSSLVPANPSSSRSNKDYAFAEIHLLESALRKIGVMLGLVYGTAGSEMIRNSISFTGEFNPLNPGKAVLAIFCFVKIPAFEFFLHALGPRIFAYINLVSLLIHSAVERHLGSVNKNLGDSYLLTWRLPGEDAVTINQKLVANAYSEAVKSTASLAVLFAIKATSKVESNQTVQRYWEKHAGGCRERLTFGFHVGWAYEGPIGSAFKLEASYLSPNVNMAARIESAALQFDVPILLSYEMYIRLEDEVQPFLRHIDTVQLKGVREDTLLYSFDVHFIYRSHSSVPSKPRTQRKRQKLKQALEEGLITVSQMFTKSEMIAAMRSLYTPLFFETYQKALMMYFAGLWTEAELLFDTQCTPLAPFDGPTRTLLEYIRSCGCRPPPNWRGVRELLCK